MTTFFVPSVQAAPAANVVGNPPPAERVVENLPPAERIVENPPPAERVVENPPVLQLRKKQIRPITRLTQPFERDTKGEEVFDLKVVYTDSKLYNPATRNYDKVSLRSYVGTNTSNKTPYVAPTIEIKPGETVRINLNNLLRIDERCIKIDNQNQPHCINFNRTNIHSHGLWISPTGNSDNVLSVVDPGVKFQYEYNIPPDHPAGTFWYHPHLHGSTALQVASGMAGALIVRGDRLPSEKTNGDIDTLLKEANSKERILVLQQIQYACLDRNGAIKVRKEKDQNGQDKVVAWICDTNDKGVIEFYDDPGGNGLFGPGTWSESGRYTSINGQILPTFKEAESGRIERWRIIHAGVRDTINLRFRKLKEGAPTFKGLKTVDADSYIRENCTGNPISYYVIADDGLTRSKAWKTDLTTLQPGYRSDALVIFPEPGNYCVVDALTSPSGTVNAQASSRQLLGVVKAKAGTQVQVPFIDEKQGYDIGGSLKDQLVAAANKLDLPISIKEKIVTDLKSDLKLIAFTPHLDIQDSEVTGKQELAFFIDLKSNPLKFEVSNAIGKNFAPKPYDGNRIDRYLTLGGVDEWTLESYLVSHPFHIHVNPFQIVKILDPNGKDVSLPDAIDNADGTNDPQYPGLKGVWKDTLWIKSLVSTASQSDKIPPPTGIYKIIVRTRYQRYIGEFVIHCHILDHEDQGMMQNVNIVIPSGGGANSGSQQQGVGNRV
ncbi:multicopper oxidase domain-containing protein [Nostoc sp. FACHB-110]|nr:multicopper oxidase domain-containing protein [Nostoc sp. FACHB-110]